MERIRIGIIGAGRNTREKHIPNLKAIENVEIVAVCNRTVESASTVSKMFSIPRVYANYTDLLSDPNIDAIVVGTWPNLHATLTILALDHGKHVLCEARMAESLEEAKRMIDAHRRYPDLVLQIVPSPFTLAYDSVIAQMVRDQSLGRLLSLRIDSYASLTKGDAVSFREEVDKSGIHFLTVGIWYEAMIRWVGEAQEVVAIANCHRPYRNRPVSYPDEVVIAGKLLSQATYSMHLSTTVRGPDGFCGHRIAFSFEKGDLYYAVDQQELWRIDRDGKRTKIPPAVSPQDAWRVERDFIDAIRGKVALPMTTPEQAYRYMVFVDAVWRSLASRQVIGIIPSPP